MITTERLSRYFGPLRAIEDMSLEIPDGRVFGLLGPNGAGKTTMMRMLTCLIGPTSGKATIDGYDIRKEKDAIKIRGMIGLLPETPGLYELLGAYKNLDYYARYYGVPKAKRERRIEGFLKDLDLWGRRDEPVGGFSKGMKQRIAIGRALMHEPKYLFLDEPTANLDPEAAKSVRDYILELKKKGNTILINTHNLSEAEKVCDEVALIKNRLVRKGRPRELAKGLFARGVRIVLEDAPADIADAVSGLEGVAKVRVEGNVLFLCMHDPDKDNPGIVSWLVGKGLRVRSVTEEEHTLEDVYLKLIGSRGDKGDMTGGEDG